MLSNDALTEFKRIFAEEHGVEISDDYALELALALLGIFDVVHKPVRKEWDEAYV